MNDSELQTAGFYVYAFVRAEKSANVESLHLTGLEDEPVFVIPGKGVSAVVSSIEATKIRPQRRNLAAHQEIVKKLSLLMSALPVAFGLIADSRHQIESVLLRNEDAFLEQSDRITDKVEMSVSMRWTKENITKYFADRYPVLQQAGELIQNGQASRDDMIEMGRTFEKLLLDEKQSHTQAFVECLSSVLSEFEIQDTRQENEVMRLACLINREDEPKFDTLVVEGAKQFNEDFQISYNGPWPPYTFVNLQLSLG